MNILLVGCGRMGGAMARGWRGKHRVFGYDPYVSIPDGVEGLTALDPSLLPEDLVIVLAVKPQMLEAVQPNLQLLDGQGSLIISLMAGVSLERLRRAIGPRSKIIRTMPNTPASIGRGITALCAGAEVDLSGRNRAEELLRAVGDVVWLETETDMDAVTALSGSGPAYFFRFTEALALAGINAGLTSDLAMQLARATFAGAAALAEQSAESLATVRTQVTSPGGTTAAGLAKLDEANRLDELISECVAAAASRSRELG